MFKKFVFIFIAIASSSAFASNMCVPPEQLVFKWETRPVWTCDTRIETYTYQMTTCNYNGTIHRGSIPSDHNVIGYLPYSKFVTRSQTHYGSQSCGSTHYVSEHETYMYTDSSGNTRTGVVYYSGSLSLVSRDVSTQTGEREIEENCRWEDQLVKVSYCSDLR